ncbi:hypothetical protein E4T47_00242 [Aureobasidium subglaciale]|nr:hypothetical protein E4T47_00242 [Aureobasidium subglaciale]
MSYHRPSSPGSRRLAHPARLSDGYYPAPTSAGYASPRSSGERIVPISTTTFVTRDAYSGRPRRSTLTDPSRPTALPTTTITSNPNISVHPRSRPAVVQSSHDRPHSPSSPHVYATRTPDYYAVPAATSHRDHSHKKLYSIDGGGKSRLVADIDINTSHGSSHRRNSVDRNSDRHSSSHHRHKAYHLSGSSAKKTDPDQGFSYTDPAAMYRDTEPRWRHRAGSVEATRPRPSSALIEPYPPRSVPRDAGPPTSRALDKFNDGAGRTNSTREPPRSSNRLSYQEPQYNDGYTSSSNRHSTAVHQDRTRDVYPRDSERARPVHRYEDRSVERRGFGIRSGSQDRYNHNMNKDSNESFDAYYSDRDHAPPRSDPRAYEYRKESDRDREYRPRDRDRLRDDGYASERDRHHDRDRRDRDRRDRERDVTPRGSGDSLTNTLLPAAATAAIGGLGAMAAAAYGSDSTAKGRDREYEDRDREKEKNKEREREQREREQEYERQQRERERDLKEREREKRERERERARDAERDSERERDRLHDRETRTRDRPRERERDRPRQSSSSDSGQEKHRSSRRHRTLGADASPPQEHDTRFVPDERQRGPEPNHIYSPEERQRAPERDYLAPAEPALEIDPDEDYRRRIEQAQRDLHGSHDDASSDRERRPNGVESVPNKIAPSTTAVPGEWPESTTRESRVRIVEPPSDKEEAQRVRGILKRPTQKFPEDPNPVREGVAPLKETTKEGIPAGARWTKIDRRLVNPQALEEAQERFEERLDCVIVLRVLTKDEIQKLADKTLEIRARSYGDEDRDRDERRERRRQEREHERRDRDEYDDEDSEDEYAPRETRMLEAPADGQEPTADFVRDRERRREREREPTYASGAL